MWVVEKETKIYMLTAILCCVDRTWLESFAEKNTQDHSAFEDNLIIVSVLRGNLPVQGCVIVLRSSTGTTTLSEALNSEIKLSWCNTKGRDSCQIISIRVALSGLTSLLAVSRSGEEQPLWLSSCFVVRTEVHIWILASADSVAHQTSLQDDYFILIYSKTTDKRQGMGEVQNKGKETLKRKQAVPHHSSVFFCHCITSLDHFFVF